MLFIPDEIQIIIDILSKNGYEAYLVGGCVRDMLLGRQPLDYDITTSASPDVVISLFDKTIPTGIKHGTVTVIINDHQVEVTTFRSDGEYNDFRRPSEVTFVSDIMQDLSRRDFTINSLAYNNKTGIIDYFGGIKDLKDKIIKTVGDPNKRFAEDALRILRLFRFSSVLNFSIEEKTFDAALCNSTSLKYISKERITNELEKLVCGERPDIIEPLIKVGGLEFLGLKKTPNFYLVKKFSENIELALFCFFYTTDVDIQEICRSMKFSNKRKKYFQDLTTMMNSEYPYNTTKLKNMMNNFEIDFIYDYLKLYEAVYNIDTFNAKKNIENIIIRKEPYRIRDLKINGNDLKKIGVTEKETGKILELLRKNVVSHAEHNKKNLLINMAQQLIRN